MKIKKMYLLILILTVLLIVLFPITIEAHSGAGAPPDTDIDSYHLNPDNYYPGDLTEDDVGQFGDYVGGIAGAIQVIGTIVSIGALMVIGIRYMISSADEKAEFKERLFPYVIGAVLLFGASNLVNIVYTVITNM